MLRKGLTSELFYLAFLIPDSGYALAQRSQGTKKTPNTGKTTPALRKLVKAGYLIRKEKKLYPVPEKLADAIINYLEDEIEVTLEDIEKRILKNMLSENMFFLFVGFDVFQEIEERPMNSHKIDALKNIADKIGFISALMLESKKKSGTNIPVNQKSFEQIQQELEEFVQNTNKTMETKVKGRKSIRNKKMDSVSILNNAMKSFIMMGVLFDKIPNETIEKFANLWSQYQGFQIGVNITNLKPIDLMNRYS